MPDQTAGGYEQLFHKALIFITTSNAPAAFSFRSIFQMLNLVKQEGVFFSSSSLFSYILSKSDKSLFDPLLLSLAHSLSFFFSFFPLPPLFFSLELTLNNIRSAAHKEGRKGRRKDRRRSRRMMKPPEELGKKKEKKKGSEKVRGKGEEEEKVAPLKAATISFFPFFFTTLPLCLTSVSPNPFPIVIIYSYILFLLSSFFFFFQLSFFLARFLSGFPFFLCKENLLINDFPLDFFFPRRVFIPRTSFKVKL